MLIPRIKKISTALLSMIFLCQVSSCEKDDICVDGDTPLLVIGFFDAEDEETAKNVNTLRIRALGFETSPESFDDRTTQDSIGLPLQVNATSSGFVFISDSADDDEMETGNIDTLTFNYNIREEFVSRACGFIANYDNLSFELTTDTENWIQNVVVEETTIENASAIHVKIFH